MRFIMSAFLALSIIITGGCSSLNRASGTLGGHVDIGPLQPVQRVGEPQPTPSPEMYAAWQIVVLSADGKREITRADIDSGGDYQIILPVGNYMVTAKPVNGGGLGMQRVESVEIFCGKSTKLDISIDTGIR
jgi:hypothetical protein